MTPFKDQILPSVILIRKGVAIEPSWMEPRQMILCSICYLTLHITVVSCISFTALIYESLYEGVFKMTDTQKAAKTMLNEPSSMNR